MFGPGMLVAPVMQQGSSSVDVYLPDTERWFEAGTGTELGQKSGWLYSSNKSTHQVSSCFKNSFVHVLGPV